jgi:hypothetical protein
MVLQNLIACQGGVISRDQAVGAGLTREEIDRRLRLRLWQPVHPGVYLAGGRALDEEARVRSALLWAGAGAVLAGAAAAWWHGMIERAPEEVVLIRPGPARTRPGVRTRPGRLAAEDLVELRGVRVTARPLTALLAGVELGPAALDRLLCTAVAFPDVHAAHLRNRRLPGAATAGLLLRGAADRSAAAAEEALVRLLREAGVRDWRRGTPVAGRPGGVTFPAGRVVIEATGWARRTDGTDPVPAGWTALRCSWHDLTERPAAVVAAAVRAARTSSDLHHPRRPVQRFPHARKARCGRSATAQPLFPAVRPVPGRESIQSGPGTQVRLRSLPGSGRAEVGLP